MLAWQLNHFEIAIRHFTFQTQRATPVLLQRHTRTSNPYSLQPPHRQHRRDIGLIGPDEEVVVVETLLLR